MAIKRCVHDYAVALDTEDGGILLILNLEGETVVVPRLHRLDAEKLSGMLDRAVKALAEVCPSL